LHQNFISGSTFDKTEKVYDCAEPCQRKVEKMTQRS